jgi:hypothetical protein
MNSYSGRILLLLVLLVSLCQSCAVSQSRAEKVCITKTGTKYHRCNCRYVANSSHEISLEEALKRDYAPCSVCKPEVTGEETEVINLEDNSVDQPKSDQSTKRSKSAVVQCTALTKAGSRCKRNATTGSSRCWQHQEK